MKPPPFSYARPETLDEALGVLAEVGEDGKVLAGGQSLLPLLSMRLAAPHVLVDINRLDELAYVRADPDGVRIGALARHAAVERSADAARVQPLLRAALRLVAHPTIRNRGTSVGSLVHADPAAELPAVLAVLGGSVRIASTAGVRDVAAADFFRGPLESAVAPGELAVEAFVPALAPDTAVAVCEVSRRHGDYAVCGVAAVVGPDGARLGFLSVAPTPQVVTVEDLRDVADAVADAVRPEADIHASAAYRRHLAITLARRAVAEADSVRATARTAAA